MKLTWYTIWVKNVGPGRPDNRGMILADQVLNEGDSIPISFLGLIERDRSGSWLCYTQLYERRYVGHEPNAHYAKAKVLRELMLEVEYRMAHFPDRLSGLHSALSLLPSGG